MTIDEFKDKSLRIGKALDQIADRTFKMTAVNSAHPKNPEFVEVMEAQDRLLKAADALLASYEASGTS